MSIALVRIDSTGLGVLFAVVAWAVFAAPAVADAAAGSRSARASVRTRAPAKVEPHHSVVVIGARAAASQRETTGDQPRAGADERAGGLLERAPNIRCDVCANTAAGALPGQPSIFVLDLRSLTNRLTSVQFRGATLKLTSFSPLGLQFRKPF